MKPARSLVRYLFVCWLVWICAADAAAQPLPIAVKYRTIATVYVDAGNAEGLEPGDRLKVLRDGTLVAELEVLRLAEHSASCKILVEHQPIEAGDAVELPPPPELLPAAELVAAVADEPASEPVPPSAPRTALARAPAPTPIVAIPPPDLAARRRRRSASSDFSRVRGSLTANWESFTDASEIGRDTDRVGARLSLRVEEIAGYPLTLRIRLSTREIASSGTLFDPQSERTTKNRFYEASLLFDPPVGRFGFQVGRMRSGEFAGIGGLDGGIGRYALSPGIDVGAFGGATPDIEQFSTDVQRMKYGVFARYVSEKATRPVRLFVAAVREEGTEGVSREFLAFNMRYQTGERWSFYQRAEADLNNGWRGEAAGSSSQLSNLSFTARAVVSPSTRLLLSYTRIERYRTEETRSIAEELFDDAIRQGLRVTLQGGAGNGLRYSLSSGLRDREGEEAGGYSFGGSLSKGNVSPLRLALSGNVTAFSNETSDGTIANLRASKRLGRGHRIGMTVGGRMSQNMLLEEPDTTTQWGRLNGWFELPGSLFATAEIELITGDQLAGQRLSLGLGYRF